MNKKFYKSTITVTILSKEPLPNDMSLADIAYSFSDGDNGGDWGLTKVEELDDKQAAAELIAIGSSPGFFGLTDEDELTTPA